MASLSPEQNFEVIEPLSVEVIDHPLRFDTPASNDNGNAQLNGLGSPNSLDGFQSVSAPASIDPSLSLANGASDLGTSIVFIPSPHPKKPPPPPPPPLTAASSRGHSSSFRLFDLDDFFPQPGNDETSMTSSFSLVNATNGSGNRHVSLDPVHRPNSDWEIMGQSIIAENFSSNNNQKGDSSNNEPSLADKLKLFWNNARYQLKANTTGLSETQPICLLGVKYMPRQASSDDITAFFKSSSSRNRANSHTVGRSHFERFKLDFWSRIWITYRKDFFPLSSADGAGLSSDLGWGCMLRSGQMMLAQAFVVYRFNRDWVFSPTSSATMAAHRQIISWFGDSANKAAAPFSIHQLTRLSQECLSKRPGDWFGPSSIAVVLRKALVEAGAVNSEIARIGMYVAVDCTIFLRDVRELTQRHNAVIIFVPVRLGMDAFDVAFEDTLKAFLGCKYSLGIIGGKPKHSLYFVGYQGSSLIYLDPHFCQPTVDTETTPQLFDVRSYHCDTPQKTSCSNIDPSLALGFMFRSRDLDDFQERISQILKENRNVFVLSESSFADHQQQCSQLDDAGVDHMGFHQLSLPPGYRSNSNNRPNSSWFVPQLKRIEHDQVRKSPRDEEGFIKIPKPPSGKY